ILDLATGVGAMAAELRQRFPDRVLVGVDRSREQLLAAARQPGLLRVQADGTKLPFPDDTFRFVHASWLLEHVPDAVAILKECRRVVEPDGVVQFTEVENASMLFHPPQPEAEKVFAALNAAQQRFGGDPYIGRRLHGLMRQAGFTDVEVKPVTLHGHAGRPAFFADLVEEFWRIFESVRESVPRELDVDRAIAELQALPQVEGASMTYTFFVARARR
ncbi:MAG: methyltransferase domain-containing protein, partial [Myxococcales bacterium]